MARNPSPTPDEGGARYDPAPPEGWFPTQDEAEAHIRRVIEEDVTRRTQLMDQVRNAARAIKNTVRAQYGDEDLDHLDPPLPLLLQNVYTLAELIEVLADVISPEEP